MSEPDLLIRLPDGSQAFIVLSSTDYAGSPEGDVTRPAPPLLDWAGLRQIIRLIEQLRQARSVPTDEGRLVESAPPPKINFQTQSSLTGLKGDP